MKLCVDDVCDANQIEEFTSNFVNVLIEIMFADVYDANQIEAFASNFALAFILQTSDQQIVCMMNVQMRPSGVGIQPAPQAHVNVNNEKPWDQYISLGY